MRTSISIRDVSFHYVPRQPVLRNISLTLEPGTTAIIGQNGAGKTTLMKLLNGLLKPTSGEVWVDDLNTSNLETHSVAKRVGLVFQNPNDQIFKSKVLDEVMFGPINIGMPVEEARTSALRALQEVELADAADENPYDLSYAFRKRICIASILAMQTDVVVFDEPTISQDSAGLDLMRRIIKDLSDAGKTVIAIVHDMNFAAENFERVIAMAQGQVVADGTPQQVFTSSEILDLAHVDAPSMIKLSQSFNMEPLINVTDFVHHFQQKIGLSKH